MDNDASSRVTVPDAEVYRIIRGQIEHEDNLVTQRLSWFLASQSFLFSAFAILLNGPEASRFGGRVQMVFFKLIPLIAIAIGALIWLSVVAGVISMGRLRRSAVQYDLKGLPTIHGPGLTRRLGLAAPLFLPPLFVTVWWILLMVG